MERKQRPLGVLILGGFNFFILGLGSLAVLLFMYFQGDSQATQVLFEEVQRQFPEANLQLALFKKVLLTQIIIALIFTFSGLGLLLGKEPARQFTLYFAFFMVALAFLSALFNRSLIRRAVLQIIYPGLLILYFTNQRVQDYFLAQNSRLDKET